MGCCGSATQKPHGRQPIPKDEANVRLCSEEQLRERMTAQQFDDLCGAQLYAGQLGTVKRRVGAGSVFVEFAHPPPAGRPLGLLRGLTRAGFTVPIWSLAHVSSNETLEIEPPSPENLDLPRVNRDCPKLQQILKNNYGVDLALVHSQIVLKFVRLPRCTNPENRGYNYKPWFDGVVQVYRTFASDGGMDRSRVLHAVKECGFVSLDEAACKAAISVVDPNADDKMSASAFFALIAWLEKCRAVFCSFAGDPPRYMRLRDTQLVYCVAMCK
eukprot:TRINITY_DN7584_c0_g4_i1.p1 TRINITY_DN7584_c0_g4~~TRINITY_DN7584_c0_g4_i1.p1  ORF type:complete len:296 (+),score=52.33 TRINITY_DN7584_c0_g4_i1:77-889(+)